MEITAATCPRLLSFILELPEHAGFRKWQLTILIHHPERGSIRIKALKYFCFTGVFWWQGSGGVQGLPTAQDRDSQLGLKKTWIPCLAVPRTALWQQVKPFTPVFLCFPFPLHICPVYWEREIYECLRDLVVQALLLKPSNGAENPALWLKAWCCRDLYSTWCGPQWGLQG